MKEQQFSQPRRSGTFSSSCRKTKCWGSQRIMHL